MTGFRFLHDLLDHTAQQHGERVAVREAEGTSITYRELSRLSDRVRDWLWSVGVRRGDRVGLWSSKSIDAVAAIFGVLKAGAAYVPLDPSGPIDRNTYILSHCSVAALILEKSFEGPWLTSVPDPCAILRLGSAGGGEALREALADEFTCLPGGRTASRASDHASPDEGTWHDLAVILYTSGSTGRPKGVALSHRNALGFVDWCSAEFGLSEDDVFSSHAPFHFDLSVFDLYVPLMYGAVVFLIGERLGKDPRRLAQVLDEARISVWYSTPSVLTMMAQYGQLERHACSKLRLVLFAGEVFPIKHLRAVKELLPHPSYFNLYGPTETNVCTSYRIPDEIPGDRTVPFPIGPVCPHLRARVVSDDGQEVLPGTEGELCIAGPNVMTGYFGAPKRTERAFLVDDDGIRWYRTGDIVVDLGDEGFHFVGRRDRMVKKRGFRVELGDIEAALYRHPAVNEAAAIALTDPEEGIRIHAVLGCPDTAKRPSIIELRGFCARELPAYMIPDTIGFCESLPKTSTNKVDYRKLERVGPV